MSTVNVVFGLLQKLLFPSKLIIRVNPIGRDSRSDCDDFELLRTRPILVRYWFQVLEFRYSIRKRFGQFRRGEAIETKKTSNCFHFELQRVKRQRLYFGPIFFELISKEDVPAGRRRRETTSLLYITFILILIFISVYYASRLFVV